MSNPSPAFQWYSKEFLSDANVMAMSMTERGIYITLISVCWIEGSIPSDISRLARICAMPFDEFLPCWQAIEPTFKADPKDDTKLQHPRLQKELKKQAEWRQKSAEGGVKSGRLRRQAAKSKQDSNNGLKGGSRVVEPNANQSPTNGEPNTNSAVCSLRSATPVKERDDSPNGSRGNGHSKKTPTDPRVKHPAIVLVRQQTGRFPPKELWDQVIEVLGDSPNEELAKQCRSKWLQKGFSPANWAWLFEWYPKGGPDGKLLPAGLRPIRSHLGEPPPG